MFQNITFISFFFFFLLLLIITFFPTPSHSQPQYSTCNNTDYAYSCGNLSDVYYPFWGQNRPSYCGAGNHFHLNCHKNITTILISSQNFTILDIYSQSYTMILKRTDLSQNLCAPQFDETYLSPTLFHYAQNVNITIHYNCNSSVYILQSNSLCGSHNLSFSYIGNDDELLRNCMRHIEVPVGDDFPIHDNYYGYYQRGVLERGLNKGFKVLYTLDKECFKCLGFEPKQYCKWQNNSDIEKYVVSSCYYDNCPHGSNDFSTSCYPLHKS